MIRKKIDEEVIRAFDCTEESMASAEISLNPPSECKLEDGSAYKRPIRKKAQILEKVMRIPVEITSCMIQWRVNVGWCGGEFAIESYMHADIETLRSTLRTPGSEVEATRRSRGEHVSAKRFQQTGQLV